MQSIETLSALSSIATAVGVGVAAYQLRVAQKQSVTTFEDSLTVQYRQVVASIPLKALFGETLSDDELKANLQYFYRYFDLCNEQAFLYLNGRISKKTWEFWKDGIITNLHRPAFARAWEIIARCAKEDFDELRLLYPINVEPSQTNLD